MPINEDFLFYVWQFQLFNHHELTTADGLPVRIIKAGQLNRNAGPDFQEAKLIIGDTEWAGNVEIHIRSSDWLRHNHTEDPAYNNVILHVVNKHDADVLRNDGSAVPVIEIGDLLPADLQSRYLTLVENLNWIPCEQHIAGIRSVQIESWLQRMLIERLEAKSIEVLALLEEYKGSWDDVFYVLLARNFGFKTNAQPFEMLSRALPQQILAKHKNSQKQIEALIFGTAGFLNDNSSQDLYYKTLKNEYAFLKRKYGLQNIDKYLWKFLRLRPQNFPTLRLAQFAALVMKSNHLISKVLEVDDIKEMANLFKDLPISDYWKGHYRFEKAAVNISAQVGNASVDNILLNSVAVILFSYGKYFGNEDVSNKAIKLLETIPFEQNHITNKFVELGLKRGNADRSQALLHMKNKYCDLKKCLTCAVGVKIVNPN